uniref:Dynamin-type G domain-containing protein n=1 Tax=Moniliophthora roreri TaxID=221103 RepID=A0A0W0FIJ2_MONRR
MNRLGRLGSSTSTKKQKDSNGSSSRGSANRDLPVPASLEPTQSNSTQIVDSDHGRRMIQLNKQIASLGAGFEFDFPRVAVVGAQSSGKNSLVEAISGVKLTFSISVNLKESDIALPMRRTKERTWYLPAA